MCKYIKSYLYFDTKQERSEFLNKYNKEIVLSKIDPFDIGVTILVENRQLSVTGEVLMKYLNDEADNEYIDTVDL